MIAALIANDPAPLGEAVANAMRRLDGAFSVVALSEGKLIAFRDPRGMRPLCLGRLDRDWVVASETCALDLVGAELEREVRPGELMVIDERVEARQVVPQGRRRRALHLRVLLPRAARLAALRASRCTARACAWASASPRSRRSTPTSSCRSPTRARRPRSVSRAR